MTLRTADLISFPREVGTHKSIKSSCPTSGRPLLAHSSFVVDLGLESRSPDSQAHGYFCYIGTPKVLSEQLLITGQCQNNGAGA